MPRAGGSGSCLSMSSAAPWLGFREAQGSEGCCVLPGGICADSSKASEGPWCTSQTWPSQLPGPLAHLLTAALLMLPQSNSYIIINMNNYLTVTTTRHWGQWNVLFRAGSSWV